MVGVCVVVVVVVDSCCLSPNRILCVLMFIQSIGGFVVK